MARTVICPACSQTEDLRGSQTPDGIQIECRACGRVWMRDEEPERCATCGGTDIATRSRALTQYSRGTQLSIVGVGSVLLCRRCDAKMLQWAEENRAIPSTYRSAAEDPDGGSGGTGSGGEITITP